MGTKAPGHYLVCDGTVYNIADYKDFSQFIKDQFGSYNYFGGDGTATFSVPDLRNNVDSVVLGTNWRNHAQSSNGNDTGGVDTYTSRPTNTAVFT